MVKNLDTVAARLAGAAYRIGNVPEEVDKEFLGRADGSMARYVFASKDAPPAAARQLVSAGLVDPNNPMAVALQEEGPAREAHSMISEQDLTRAAARKSLNISKSTDHRVVRVIAAALTRRLNQGKMSHKDVAKGFEEITKSAVTNECAETARQAGEAFAAVSIAGVTLRDRDRQKRSHRSEHELE